MALKNQTRIVQQRGTQSQVEGYTGTLEEGAIAYATDTNQIGIYTGGSWVWVGGSLDDLDDVMITSVAQGDVLQYSGSTWVNSAISAGEVLVQDGASAPPVMLTNEDEDDFLYED